MEHPSFDITSMLFILMNCVTLSMFDPYDRECLTERCQTLQWLEFAFNIFFTVECVCKITAMGFWGERSYMDDPWNGDYTPSTLLTLTLTLILTPNPPSPPGSQFWTSSS